MSTQTDEFAALRAEVAELRARLEERVSERPAPTHRRLTRRLAVLALALALVLPAGAVFAAHRFSDVPTGHQFHNAITAIADAGITTGCGGGRYCPDGLVTRGQMAAFLSRLGALQAGSAPKVNARTSQSTDGWSIGCPPNTTYAAGLCFDNAQRGAATSILDAAERCASINASPLQAGHRWHLPSATRLIAASRATSLNLEIAPEWTSDMWEDPVSGLMGLQVFHNLSFEVAQGEVWTDAAQYRCATEPTSWDGISISLP